MARRNINNLRYINDNTLMAESEEELKSLLMRVKEESEKPGLKLNNQKTKIMAFSPITSQQIDGENMEIVTDFIFLGSKINLDSARSALESRRVSLGAHWVDSRGIETRVTKTPGETIVCSVQFSGSVVSDSLQSYESQHARPPCPSPTPGVH